LRFTGKRSGRTQAAIFGDSARGRSLKLKARKTGGGVLQLLRDGSVIATGSRSLARTVTATGRYGLRSRTARSPRPWAPDLVHEGQARQGQLARLLEPLAQHPEHAADHLALDRLALRELRKSPIAAGSGAGARRGAFGSFGAGMCSSGLSAGAERGGPRGAPRAAREDLARALRVDPRAVLRVQRRGLRRGRRRRPPAPSSTTGRACACARPGVGTPFSLSSVTAASPVPIAVSSSPTS
jgi:hypothetical protein